MVIHCTKSLLNEMGAKPVEDPQFNPLYSWHANFIKIARRKAIVLVNDKNRYVIVLGGLKAKDFSKLSELIKDAIRETLLADGIKIDVIQQYINNSPNIVFCKTSTRSMVARMNKGCEMVSYFEDEFTLESLFQTSIAIKASGYLCKFDDGDYHQPNEAMYEDLEAISGDTIFSCKAVKMKVSLQLTNHKVSRELIAPHKVTFKELHTILQYAFGWQNRHLHEFLVYDENEKLATYILDKEFADDYPSLVEIKFDHNTKISEYIPSKFKLTYIYDFGDYWIHEIIVEEIIEDYSCNYPVCVAGEGNCPPEDVGGDGGYDEFLAIYNNPEHEDHKVIADWARSQWYKEFDLDLTNQWLK